MVRPWERVFLGEGCSARTVGGLSSQNQKNIVRVSMLVGYYHSEILYVPRSGRYGHRPEGYLQKFWREKFYLKLDAHRFLFCGIKDLLLHSCWQNVTFGTPRSEECTPGWRKCTQGSPKVCPRVPKVFPRVPKVFPRVPKVFPRVPKVFPRVPKVFPRVPKVFPRVP